MTVSEAFRTEAATVGHSGLATTFRRVADAIDSGDRMLLKEALHVDNKNTRSTFERITGKKLPKGVGATNKFVDNWLAEQTTGNPTEV